jgi:hypothetical protein
LFPKDKKDLYIGRYKNSLIISNLEIPVSFYSEKLNETEKKFISLAPHSEIGAFVLHSVVNYWGYAIIQNGQKIRVKSGNGDDGVTIDIGDPLPQEEELLSKSKVDADGKRLYHLDSDSDEPYTEDQVGEEFVFQMYRRYFGEQLDHDDELIEVLCKGYSIRVKPWWKFW